MPPRFYVNWELEPGLVPIQGAEAHHMASVHRLCPGDPIRLFNGDGGEYPAEVKEVSRRGLLVQVLGRQTPERELGFRLEVAAPLPKGDRGQFLVEKLAELGVTRYVPLRTRRSVIHPGDSRLERLQRHVIEASKQCGRNVLMEVEPTVHWETYCGRAALPENRVLAHLFPKQDGGGMMRSSANQPMMERTTLSSSDVAVAIGPEGGFTHEEVELGRVNGWRLVGLGPRVLRVEAVALVLATWGAGCLAALLSVH